MPIKESVKEFVDRAMKDIKIDIDIEYCKKHDIKFKDTPDVETEDEIWARLGDTKKNKAIFDYLTKKD